MTCPPLCRIQFLSISLTANLGIGVSRKFAMTAKASVFHVNNCVVEHNAIYSIIAV